MSRNRETFERRVGRIYAGDRIAFWDPALILLAATLLALSFAGVARDARGAMQQASPAPGATAAVAGAAQTSAPLCSVKGSGDIVITCDYFVSPHAADEKNGARIALEHASLSFATDDESHMKIGLTFSNRGGAAMTEARTVYIAIDGTDDKNVMRRALPHVDLTKLAPGETLSFSEILLAPAFAPGVYNIHLWIPSPEPLLKFNAKENFLLDNLGVPDKASGLNTLATFTVNASAGRKKRSH